MRAPSSETGFLGRKWMVKTRPTFGRFDVGPNSKKYSNKYVNQSNICVWNNATSKHILDSSHVDIWRFWNLLVCVCECIIQLRKFESDAITIISLVDKYQQSLNENNFPAHYIHNSLNFIVFPFCRSITYAHNGTHHPHLFRIPYSRMHNHCVKTVLHGV